VVPEEGESHAERGEQNADAEVLIVHEVFEARVRLQY
jgi:hypothetical protein